MEWLLLQMYLDFLRYGDLVWDEEVREELMGRSLPPMAIGPNQACEILFWFTAHRAAMIRRQG